MITTSRSLSQSRILLLVVMAFLVSAPGWSSTGANDSITSTAPITLKSVEAHRTDDGKQTMVALQADFPLSYSVNSSKPDFWSLTLDGVDSHQVGRELSVGSPHLDRILIRDVSGNTGRSAAQVDFQGVWAKERKIRLSGNDLFVEFSGEREKSTEEKTPVTVSLPTPLANAMAIGGDGAVLARNTGEISMPAPSSIPAPAKAAPAAEMMSEDANRLVVGSGKSLTLGLEATVKRVSVANPAIADAVVISPRQILINGIAPGSTSLVLWFGSGEPKNYDLLVKMDTHALNQRLQQFFPNETIQVGASKETLVLFGTVSDPEIGERAAKIASDYTGKVVNNLTYPTEGRKQILLKIMFAEVARNAMTELSASFLRMDPNNPRGDHEGLITTGTPGPAKTFVPDSGSAGPDFNFTDAINVFAFNFRDKIAGFITALKTRGLVQVLAEPSLIAADGEKASFLAGGEFPVPVAQAGAGFTSVTISWKKFGISLDFTPEIREDGTIELKVEPEVSALDFANAVTLGGFRVPSLRVRRASTEVELKDGQSFAIAGLYSADLQQTKNKIPLLGDIPLLGYLFRSKNLQKNKTELLVIATPTLVEPSNSEDATEAPEFELGMDIKPEKKLREPEPLTPREASKQGS